MSLPPTVDYVVPEPTARVAKAAFPQGALCLQIYDHFGTLFQDSSCVDLFPRRGQPAAAPFRLALVTILQFGEGRSDRAAADAVRRRLDWKYLLCLERDDPGFDYSVLSEFRDRLLSGAAERRLLDQVLETLHAHHLVKARVRARTDSTQVLAAVREVNRLERGMETRRAALKALATVIPEGVQETIPGEWVECYGPRAEDARLPQEDAQRRADAEAVGNDGEALLEALWAEHAPRWWRELPAIESLRPVWRQNFSPVDGRGRRWRERDHGPPGSRYINSPYAPEARYSKKRDKSWLGYQVQVTESGAEGLPQLITHIPTTAATTGDHDALPAMHQALERTALLPDTHWGDTGYVEVKRVIESRDDYGVDLFGPIPGNPRWPFQQGAGFDLASCHVDWQAQRVTCPKGKLSAVVRPDVDGRGHAVMRAVFNRDDGGRCDRLSPCTSAAGRRRTMTLNPPPL